METKQTLERDMNVIKEWTTTYSLPILDEKSVHVWSVRLPLADQLLACLHPLLSEQEQERAQRFYFERDRKRMVATWGVLRSLLGLYLGQDAAQLQFQTNEYGKPSLQPLHDESIVFNVSHSHELILLAFTYGRQLGVDVEWMRTNVDYDEVAKHSFSRREYATWQALPEESKPVAFFQCWTRKEAYIKARGMGLSLDLRLFDMSFCVGEPVRLLESREDQREVDRWAFWKLEPGANYASALAVEGHGCQLQTWSWDAFLHTTGSSMEPGNGECQVD